VCGATGARGLPGRLCCRAKGTPAWARRAQEERQNLLRFGRRVGQIPYRPGGSDGTDLDPAGDEVRDLRKAAN